MLCKVASISFLLAIVFARRRRASIKEAAFIDIQPFGMEMTSLAWENVVVSFFFFFIHTHKTVSKVARWTNRVGRFDDLVIRYQDITTSIYLRPTTQFMQRTLNALINVPGYNNTRGQTDLSRTCAILHRESDAKLLMETSRTQFSESSRCRRPRCREELSHKSSSAETNPFYR